MIGDLKFRVWNQKDNKMITAEALYNSSIFLNVGVQGYFIDDKPEHIFMQYIGLKDKDEKLIYDGDIIQVGIEDWQDPEIYIVKYDNYMLRWIFEALDRKSDYCYGDSVPNSEEIIVLGNIYENPELLNIKN